MFSSNTATLFYTWFCLVLMMVRLLNGLATAVATTATGTIAAYITPPTRKSEGISYSH